MAASSSRCCPFLPPDGASAAKSAALICPLSRRRPFPSLWCHMMIGSAATVSSCLTCITTSPLPTVSKDVEEAANPRLLQVSCLVLFRGLLSSRKGMVSTV